MAGLCPYPQIGQIVPGRVTKLVPFGAFVRVEEGIEGLVHVSELAERHVEIPEQVVQVNDDVMVKIIDIDLERRRISLSLKQANEGVDATAPTTSRRSTAWLPPTTSRATTSTRRASTRRPASGWKATRSSARLGSSSTPRRARWEAHKKQVEDADGASAPPSSSSHPPFASDAEPAPAPAGPEARTPTRLCRRFVKLTGDGDLEPRSPTRTCRGCWPWCG